MDAEQIVQEVADRVREIVSDAEQRAAQIVRDAEQEASRIRARAETEGQERLAQVRAALDEVQVKLDGGASAASVEAEVEPGPVIVPEPEPPDIPEPAPDPPPEPAPPLIPEPTPPPDEGTPPQVGAKPGAEPKADDPAGARLVAMNMALDGASREAIEGHLAESYSLDDAGAIVDDVLAFAAK